jgi:hypothetical protein
MATGLFSPVLGPEIVAVGVAFPVAPGAYSVMELPRLATKIVPAVGAADVAEAAEAE